MKNFKKTLAVVLALAIVAVSFAACSNKKGSATNGVVYKIGLCNYVQDASLEQIEENIKSQLKAIGDQKGVNFEIIAQNANADDNTLNQIVSSFTQQNVDLMIGIATPVAIAMQSATETNQIPVVFSAVSDPEGAQLVASNNAPGANITGTSDYLDTNAIFSLMLAQNPETKKVGLLYDAGQDSSTKPIKDAKAFLQGKGIEIVEKTGTTVDEIKLAADALVNEKVDAIFTPTDNTVMTAELSIYEKFADAGIPHYTGADSFALNGAFLGYGVDYANLGKVTADMVAEILIDGKSPSTLAVKTFDNGTATINTEICTKLGYDFETLKTTFAPLCQEVKGIQTAESFTSAQ